MSKKENKKLNKKTLDVIIVVIATISTFMYGANTGVDNAIKSQAAAPPKQKIERTVEVKYAPPLVAQKEQVSPKEVGRMAETADAPIHKAKTESVEAPIYEEEDQRHFDELPQTLYQYELDVAGRYGDKDGDVPEDEQFNPPQEEAAYDGEETVEPGPLYFGRE